jgi:hypothetical protein
VQILTDTPTRTKFQRFLSNPPLYSFKKLLVSTPLLQQGLHTMSLAKVVPDSLRDRECKRTFLRKCPPVPYIPKKDPVQETVSALKDQHLKTTIGEDTTLHLNAIGRVLRFHRPGVFGHSKYPCGRRCQCKSLFARIPACGGCPIPLGTFQSKQIYGRCVCSIVLFNNPLWE